MFAKIRRSSWMQNRCGKSHAVKRQTRKSLHGSPTQEGKSTQTYVSEWLVCITSMIYTNCLEKGIYLNLWKRANVLPIHKKESCQLTTNYRPISLLPICGKLFEKIIFDEIHTSARKQFVVPQTIRISTR